MLTDVGPMELVALMILAVLLFGPDKLPELIQNVTGFLHKHVLGSDGLGLEELHDALDPRKELTQIADAVREAADISTENVPAAPGVDLAKDVAPAKRVTLTKEGAATSERPLFDPETT
ncbi:twin-arginine translocase TatA/TatE family subunit [Stenotrophomonas sp. NPDC087984]